MTMRFRLWSRNGDDATENSLSREETDGHAPPETDLIYLISGKTPLPTQGR